MADPALAALRAKELGKPGTVLSAASPVAGDLQVNERAIGKVCHN